MTAGVILPQSGSGRITRIVRETVPGQTPTGADWLIARTTGGAGTSSEIDTIESSELPGEVLGVRDVIRTGERGLFELPFELVYDGVTDLMMSSLLNNEWATDSLVAGGTDITFTLEDDLPTIKSSEYIKNAQCGVLNLSFQSGQIVTGSFQGQGGDTGVEDQRIVLPAAGDITFTSPDLIDYSASTLPGTPPVAGDFVFIEGATAPTSNNGYYKIKSVVGNSVQVFGSLATSTESNITSRFSGLTQYDLSSPNSEFKSIVQAMKCGNNVEAKIDGVDVLEYGFRFPQVDVSINTALTDLREITEDAPYATLPTDRTIEITVNWHVINFLPIRHIRDDREFSLSISASDPANNKYTFTFPRCKSSNASKGPATKGEVMTGDWAISSLLDGSNVNIQIDRAAGP